MNNLQTALQTLQLKDQADIDRIQAQLISLAVDLAIFRLKQANELSHDELTTLDKVLADSTGLSESQLEQLFASPDRQKVLSQAAEDAFDEAFDAVQSQPK